MVLLDLSRYPELQPMPKQSPSHKPTTAAPQRAPASVYRRRSHNGRAATAPINAMDTKAIVSPVRYPGFELPGPNDQTPKNPTKPTRPTSSAPITIPPTNCAISAFRSGLSKFQS